MTASLSGIKACVFDAYGTLFDVMAAAERARDVLGDKAGPLGELWRTKQLEYTWLRSLMGAPWKDFWGVTGDGLDYAMEALGLEDETLRGRLMNLYLQLDAYPEAKEVLGLLKAAGLKTAILSNGSSGMLSSAVTAANLCHELDLVLSVDEVEVYKTDPRTYQLAVDDLDVEAGAICFLSSNAWDVAGAAHFGLQVVWVNRFGRTAERLPGRPIAEIKDISGLLPLLRL